MAGDIIILATDGLFDNMDLDEIVAEVDLWDKQHAAATSSSHDPEGTALKAVAVAVRGSGSSAESHPAAVPDINVLAEQLVHKARTLSLDKNRDSPFALLAKENDIMWGGGMPDDTTVVVARVTSH
jgi:protein phosphatase PTC7